MIGSLRCSGVFVAGWQWALVLITGFAGWTALLRWRTLKYTPTSHIAATAPGVLEIGGIAESAGEPCTISQWKKRPCLWCRYEVEEFHWHGSGGFGGPGWRAVDSGETDATFLLRDASGSCVIDPACAAIVTQHRERWRVGNRRYTEWTLHRGDSLRVIGVFGARGATSVAVPFDLSAVLAATLADWRKEMPRLFSRYDINADNPAHGLSWQEVRREAIRAVIRDQARQAVPMEGCAPSHLASGQFFLVSNVSRIQWMRRAIFRAWLHLAICAGVLSQIAWVCR